MKEGGREGGKEKGKETEQWVGGWTGTEPKVAQRLHQQQFYSRKQTHYSVTKDLRLNCLDSLQFELYGCRYEGS